MAAKDIEAGRAHVVLRIRDLLTQGLKTAEQRMQRFGRYVATSAGIISGGAFAGMIWPLKLAADMEQASVSFEVFIGNAQVAKQLIGDIETMAAKTPFQFDELKDSAQLLMGFGATSAQVLPMLQMLGDASGGNSERFQRLSLAFGQVMAKGRLMGQEVIQMTEQGFNPLAEMSKLTGKSMATLMKQMEDGLISFPMLVSAFQSATGPGGRFNGMMIKQSQTLTGLFSSLVDYTKMAARALGDALLPVFKSLVTTGIDLAKGFATIVRNNIGLVASIGKAVLVVGAVAGAFAALGTAVMGGGFVLGLIGSGLAFIGTVLATIFSPLGILIGILAGLAGTAIYFRAAMFEAFQGLVVWAQPVIDAFGRILWAGEGAVQGVVEALSAGNIQLAGTIAVTALKSMFWQAAHEIPGSAAVLASSFGKALLAGRWDLIVGMMMTKAKIWVSDTAQGIGAIWDTLVYGIRTGWNTASTFLASAMLKAVAGINYAFVGLQIMFDTLVTSANMAANAVKGFFTGSSAQVAEQNKKLSEELTARTGKRAEGARTYDTGLQKTLAEDAARTQAKIRQDFEKSFASRAGGGEQLRSQLADLENQARTAASDQGVSTAAAAADKARAELDAAIASAADSKAATEKNLDLSNRVPGLNASPSLPKVESRGTFSAAAAIAFGGGSGTMDQVANNTLYTRRYLKEIKDKPGVAFS